MAWSPPSSLAGSPRMISTTRSRIWWPDARRHRGVVVTRRLASWLAVAALGLSMLVFAAVDEGPPLNNADRAYSLAQDLPARSVRGSRSPERRRRRPQHSARSGSGSTRAIDAFVARPARRHLRRRRRLHLRRRRHRPRVDPPSRGRSGSGRRPWSGVPSMATRRRSRGDR